MSLWPIQTRTRSASPFVALIIAEPKTWLQGSTSGPFRVCRSAMTWDTLPRWTYQTSTTLVGRRRDRISGRGDGPQTLVYAPPVTNLYSLWELPRAASFLRRLSEEARLVVFNPRGTGLSDRPSNMTLESRVDDLNAVLDAIGQERATIFGGDVSANVCALFAASFPERCDRLVLFVPSCPHASIGLLSVRGRRKRRHWSGFGSGEPRGETETCSRRSHGRSLIQR